MGSSTSKVASRPGTLQAGVVFPVPPPPYMQARWPCGSILPKTILRLAGGGRARTARDAAAARVSVRRAREVELLLEPPAEPRVPWPRRCRG